MQYGCQTEMNKNKKPLLFRYVFFGGLMLISLGLASSVGLQPAQALTPLMVVVGGLVALTTVVGSGPRAFM